MEAKDFSITEEKVELTVEVKDENAAVFWKRDNKELNLGEKYAASAEGLKRTLTITDAGRVDGTDGRVECSRCSSRTVDLF